MLWAAMISGLTLGAAGSLHCVGMCGPLLLALPLDAAGKWQVMRKMLVYHVGRILTYAALGVLFGLLGKGLAIAGFQKILSIGAGAFMLGMAFSTRGKITYCLSMRNWSFRKTWSQNVSTSAESWETWLEPR